MRTKDCNRYDAIYREQLAANPEIKRYTVWLRTEAQFRQETGKPKYKNYESFRVNYSRRQSKNRKTVKR